MPKTEPTEPKLQTTPDDPIIIDSDSDCDLLPVKKPHSPAKCPVIKDSQEEFPPIQVSDVQVIPNSQPLQVPPQVPLQVPPQVPPQVPLQVPPKKKVTFQIKKVQLNLCHLMFHQIQHQRCHRIHQCHPNLMYC